MNHVRDWEHCLNSHESQEEFSAGKWHDQIYVLIKILLAGKLCWVLAHVPKNICTRKFLYLEEFNHTFSVLYIRTLLIAYHIWMYFILYMPVYIIHSYKCITGQVCTTHGRSCSGPNPLWEHFPHTSNRKFLETSRVSENLTIYPKIASDSTSEEFTPTRLHPSPPLQTLVKPLVYLLSFWLTSYRWVPNTPFLGSINFTEQLTEFREIRYLLAYLFIIEGYNPGIARCKRCVG